MPTPSVPALLLLQLALAACGGDVAGSGARGTGGSALASCTWTPNMCVQSIPASCVDLGVGLDAGLCSGSTCIGLPVDQTMCSACPSGYDHSCVVTCGDCSIYPTAGSALSIASPVAALECLSAACEGH